MIFVTGEIVVEEGAVEKMKDALRSVEEETRKEQGCLTYAFSVDVNDSTMVRVFERWESMDALRAHFGTAHIAAFGRSMAAMTPKSMNVTAWDVAGEVELPR